MEIIRHAITCKICHEILDSPVVLPCGESVCQKHTNRVEEEMACFMCGQKHLIPMGGFSPNKAFAMVLNTRIGELNIGEQYNRAQNESFKRMENALRDLRVSLNDPDYTISEPIESLKRRAELKREELKLKIDEEVGMLVDQLDAYENQCKTNHRLNSEMVVRANELCEKIERCEEELNEWQRDMNVLKIDEVKWREVNDICELIVQDLNNDSNAWRNCLLMNRIKHFELKLLELESLSLKLKNKIDSKILDLGQRNDLLDLCEFPFNSDWKLLYRASEHGFSGSAFHEKCNNKLNTLTIVKSLNGNIFGGFCTAKWNPSERFIKDSNAFLFSLVNQEDKKIKIEIDQEPNNNAIQCHEATGPIFGGIHINGGDRDIYIASNSNMNTTSYSNLGRCYRHEDYQFGSQRAKELLAGSYNFQVIEIEVYQRI